MSPSMTKRHFSLIAASISSSLALCKNEDEKLGALNLARRLFLICAASNVNFDKARFLAVAGLIEVDMPDPDYGGSRTLRLTRDGSLFYNPE